MAVVSGLSVFTFLQEKRRKIEEAEFHRLLDLFPLVRPRDYHIELDPAKQSTSWPPPQNEMKKWQDAWEELDEDKKQTVDQAFDLHDAFWEKLKLAAEKKVGAAEAKRFCNAFQKVHGRLACMIIIVYEELSLDAARRFINSTNPRE